MSGKFYVMADQERGGAWEFTADQVEQALLSAWPRAEMTGPMSNVQACELSVPVQGDDDRPVEITYYAERRFFSFADKDPLDARFRVIFTVLTTLSPTVPVVWTTDWDTTLQHVDLSVGMPELLRSFEPRRQS